MSRQPGATARCNWFLICISKLKSPAIAGLQIALSIYLTDHCKEQFFIVHFNLVVRSRLSAFNIKICENTFLDHHDIQVSYHAESAAERFTEFSALIETVGAIKGSDGRHRKIVSKPADFARPDTFSDQKTVKKTFFTSTAC